MPSAPQPVHHIEPEAPAIQPSVSKRLLTPEIPIGGLERAMPSWLNEPPQQAGPVSTPQPGSAPVTPSIPVVSPAVPPAVAATDTSSFISESDLPAWIRQLAEADEAKKAEEAANAVATAAQQAATANGAGQNLFGEGSLARRISQLPGEAEPPTVASNPWLSRREQAEPAATAQSDIWSKPMSSIPRERSETTQAAQLAPESAQPVAPETNQSTFSPVVNKVASASPVLRWVLIGAVAVSVLAIVAYLFLLGGS
jgi:type II secretory pathway pseudopilin PulG